ncbi:MULTISPECIES: PBECR2 nuclease fold domain-containing protein, partial [unclassified Campylobacter]|uniref:PBECR2 nuclease fold domain-containing protein n=1 Tax=unclassified Campylobacter TaxID=2593542 RepID=UPI003D32F9E9
EVVSNASVKTILYTNKNGKFRVGLSKGWHGKGENEWVITAYKKEKEPSRSVVRPSSDLGQNGTDLSANGLNKIIPQQTSKSENLTQNNQNFTIQGNQATKSDLNVNVSVDDWVKELSQINSNELTANLFILQQKHPELFKKPSDVYKMLVQIKNNPTHFFKNNRPDMALIAKILQDGSVGKMAIVKDSGKVSHITKSTKDRELKRLQNVNERELGAGSPYPTQQSSKTLPANGDGAKAHSLATDEIILQQELKSEISSQISLDGINDVVKNLAQNRDIALKLNPKADILNLVNDFKEPIKTPLFTSKISLDKMLNHLAQKPDFDRRIEYINLVKPTLENPLFITKEGDRYRFVKTFLDDKDKVVKFLSVIEDDKGEFIGITATPLKNTDVKNILKGDIVWGGDMLTNQSTPRIANLQALSTEGKGLDAI